MNGLVAGLHWPHSVHPITSGDYFNLYHLAQCEIGRGDGCNFSIYQRYATSSMAA